MIQNRFLLRILSLAVVSGITLITALPEATAQTRPHSSGGQDFFCDRGTQVSGFPFDLFAWDAIPWGMKRDDFLDRYKEQIKQCNWEVDKKGKEIFARYNDPETEQVTSQVKFSFYGEDKTLSRVEIYDARSISPVADRLSQEFGAPQEVAHLTLLDPNNRAQTRIYKGVWNLPVAKAKAISSWHLVFEPVSLKELL